MKKLLLLVLPVFMLFGCASVQQPQEAGQGEELPVVETPSSERFPEIESAESVDDCKPLTNLLERDLCFSRIAKQNSDAVVCGLIEKDTVKAGCFESLAISLHDPAICGKNTSTTLRNSCYKNVAIEFSDYTVCDAVSEPSLVADCYAKVAVKKQDKSICEKITNPIYSQKCFDET